MTNTLNKPTLPFLTATGRLLLAGALAIVEDKLVISGTTANSVYYKTDLEPCAVAAIVNDSSPRTTEWPAQGARIIAIADMVADAAPQKPTSSQSASTLYEMVTTASSATKKVSTLPAGLYIVKVTDANSNLFSAKLLKQ